MKSSSNHTATNSPPPLPLPNSSPVSTSIDKNLQKQIDEREKLFLLYENEGKIGDTTTDHLQQPARLSTIDPNFIDQHGFIQEQPIRPLTVSERKQLQQELKRSERWNKMLKKSHENFNSNNEQLRRRMYKGLPNTLRGAFWSRLLNLDEILRVNQGYYDLLKTKARLSSTYLSQIDLDVNRTYRNHQMFRNRYCLRQKHLFSILAAYSVYNTEVGYTQGMNEIVAFLLFYLPEEEAFWALCQLMTSSPWTMHGLFSPGFPKLLRFQSQFEKILKKMLPKIYKHFNACQFRTDPYTIRWFMLAYLNSIPFPLSLRLWDIFILDGEQVLLTTAFCILRIHRKRILSLKNPDTLNTFLKDELRINFANSLLTLDEIIEEFVVCYEKLKQNNLLTLPAPTENELPTKPFNISMGDITKLGNKTTKKSLTPDESNKTVSPTTLRSNGLASRITTTQISPIVNPKPIAQTFLVTSAAPLARIDDDFPPSIPLLDTSIDDRYVDVKYSSKTSTNDETFIIRYDSCTILSSTDHSFSGCRRQFKYHSGTGEDDDDETVSSKSAVPDDDEHAQISQMITTSFAHTDPEHYRIKRSPSFYDNVADDEQLVEYYQRPQQYVFDTAIR